MARIR
jgi:hypothetical protein